MVTMFAALAFAAFLNGRDSERNPGRNFKQKKRTAWWIASLALLACALLTKEMAVMFSALVGIYAWLHPAETRASPGQRILGAVREAAPYAVVTIAYVLLRKHALLHATGQFDPSHGMMDMARTLPLVLSVYLRQLLVPVGITGLYYTPYVTGAILSQVVVPAAVLGAALIGIVVLESARREFDGRVCGVVAAGGAGAGAVSAQF